LGTVDCVHWPEAQDGLINALRADRNECVRLEAAFALGRGCCCNRKTIEAMRLTVEGSDADGNPPENSERVRAGAAAALNHCRACLTEKVLEAPTGPPQELPTGPPQELPRPKPEGKGEANDSAAYYKRVGQMSRALIVQRARYTLDHADLTLGRPVAVAAPSPARSGLVAVINRAFTYTGVASQEPQSMQEAPAATSMAIRPMPEPRQTRSAHPGTKIKPISTKPAMPAKPAAAARPTASLDAPAQSVSVYHPSVSPSQQVRKTPEPMPVQGAADMSSSPY